MSGQTIGYIRVSSVGQNTARQLDGIKLDRVFEERKSGKNMERPELVACLDYVRQGDTLMVHSIDRLARSLADLEAIAKRMIDKGVTLRFVKEGLTVDGSSTSKLVMQVFGAVAEFERALLHERQAEGIAKAKEAGKHLGRKATLTEEQTREVLARAKAGADKSKLAAEFGISRATVYNVIERAKSS